MKHTILAAISLLALSTAFGADPITIDGAHNCCGGCKRSIAKALENVRDVSIDEKKGTITAKSKSDARKAIEALAKEGFYATAGGASSSEAKPVTSSAPAKKMTSATVSGVHNCCLKCRNLIQDAVREVAGVKSIAIEPEAKNFTVQGEFTKEDLLASLNKAGFTGTIK